METNYPDFEVLFVDNGSTDDSVDFVSNEYEKNPRFRIMRNKQNLGYAGGNNIGLRNAKGEYFCLLNNDVKVDPDWLRALVDAFKFPDVGVAQSKIVRLDKPDVIDCAGGLLDTFGYHYEIGKGESALNYQIPREIFYAKGASFLVKREVLIKTGLFDSDIFLYYDEVDLCWRVWLSGYKVVYAPSSIVWHASGATSFSMQQKKLFFYSRNHLLVVLKNYGLANAFKTLAVSILFETRNFSLFLLRRKPLFALSLFQGFVWNLTSLKSTWRKRQIVQSRVREVSDKEIKNRMLKPLPPFPLYLLYSRKRYQRAGRAM